MKFTIFFFFLCAETALLQAQCKTQTLTDGNFTATGEVCKKNIKNSYGSKYTADLRSGNWTFLSIDGVLYKKGNYLMDGELFTKNGIWEFYNETGKAFFKMEYVLDRPVKWIALDSGANYAGNDSLRIFKPDSAHWQIDFSEKGKLKSWTVDEIAKWEPYAAPTAEKKPYKPIVGIVGLNQEEADASNAPKAVKTNIIWKDEEMLEMFSGVESFIDSQVQLQPEEQNLILNPKFLSNGKPLKEGKYVLNNKIVDHWSNAIESPDVFSADGMAILGFRAAGTNYEVVKATLETPLEADKTYCFSVQVKLNSGSIYALNRVGAWVSAFDGKQLTREHINGEVSEEGTFILSPPNVPICLREQWMTVQGRFKATGGEKYVYFGHFSDESNIKHWALDSIYTLVPGSNDIYYFLRNPIIAAVLDEAKCICNIPNCTPPAELPKEPEVDSFVLSTVQFATAKWDLLEIAFPALDSLAEYLQANESYTLVVVGHTDNQGKPKENLILSEKRAKAVIKYLESQGIDIARMSYQGKGDTDPIDDNDYEEGRERNRRVEFKVKKGP
ncbi:MAG: OmpA family protein [Bacteroidia bacterium]|nr:OmpA family protein [Bacteroidia bacterium]